MESLRFLMVSTHFPPHHLGGDAVLVDYLSRELASAGHEVHVLAFPGAYSALRGTKGPGRDDGDESHVEEHLFEPPMPKMDMVRTLVFGSAPRAERELGSLCKQLRPDVVHWHNTKGFMGTPRPLAGAANLYTAHDYYAICPRSNLLRPDLSVCKGPYNCISCHLRWRKPPPIWRTRRNRRLTFDDRLAVISPSDFLSKEFAKEGLRVDAVINNFVPRPAAAQSPNPSDRHTLVYAGMLERHKGVTTLLRGFYESKDLQGFRLVIVGDGSSREELARLVSEMRLNDRVELTGFVPRQRLSHIRASAAFQVIPSEWPENAPLTAIESLSFGTPIMTSDQGGLPEISGKDTDAIMFRARDPASLADCLVRAWESIDSLDKRRTRAKRVYEENYLPSIHMRRYMDFLGERSSN